MSNVENAIPVAPTASTTLRENPHLGSSRVPFMKSTTGVCVVRRLSRASRGSAAAGAAAAAGADAAAAAAPPTPKCCRTLPASARASAPSSASIFSAPRWNVKNGTALTSYRSARSSHASASTRANVTAGRAAASSRMSASIAPHGSHHDAQKCVTTRAFGRARSASCSAAERASTSDIDDERSRSRRGEARERTGAREI
eukprot:30934-Pelagococcus_subviridis.AAC.4